MKILLIIFSIILIPIQSFAVPFAFEPGKPARASEVNANFNFLSTEIENLQTDQSALDSDISDLNADLFTLNLFATGTSNDLSSLSSTVSDLNSEVVTLDSAVSQNTSDFSDLDSALTALETTVGNLDTDLTTVESNVSDLTTTVSGLETTVSGLSAGTCNQAGYANPNGASDFSYNAVSSVPGDVISLNVNGVSEFLTIAKMPFKDVQSGVMYSITFPLATFDVDSTNGLTVINNDATCFGDITISGFGAKIRADEEQVIKLDAVTDTLTVERNYSFRSIMIKVGSSIVSLPVSFYNYSSQDTAVSDGLYDMTGVLTSSDFDRSSTTTLAEIDAFIDYIVITEVE